MRIRVRFFASVRQMTGVDSEELEVKEGQAVGTLIVDLKRRHEALEEKMKMLVAINGEYAETDTVLKEGDEVALFPPVSGG